MFGQDHLTLRISQLKSDEEWTSKGEGFCFLIPIRGSGNYSGDSATGLLSPGALLAFNRSVVVTVSAAKGGEFLFGSFSLCLEHLFPAFGLQDISLLKQCAEGLNRVNHYPAGSPLASKCHRLASEAPPDFNFEHRIQLMRLAAAVFAEESRNTRGGRAAYGRGDSHILRVLAGLSTDELLTSSVVTLASRFGCSRRHLNRLFHQHFGVSVSKLKMEARLIKATWLLRDPDLKIISLAEQCGFNHLGFFNTCFKKRFGTSPGDWRKSAAEKAEIPAGRAGLGCPLGSTGLCHYLASHTESREPDRYRRRTPERGGVLL